MKHLLLLIMIISFSISLFAAEYWSSPPGGIWEAADGSTWVDGNIPSGAQQDIIHITEGSTVTASSFRFSKETTIYIETNATLIFGDLEIDIADIDARKDFILVIADGGTLTVNGDFKTIKDASLTIDGVIDVNGDLSLNNGSALVGTGTVTADSYSGNGSIFGTSPVSDLVDGVSYEDGGATAKPLPIELTYFQAQNSENSVIINWQTATEKNNDYFTLERSKDGLNYEVVGTVLGAGNSLTTLNYTYSDNNPVNGVSYYRLMQTDYDGAFEVFSPVSVSYLNESELKIGPNPAIDKFHVSIGGEMGTGVIKLYNLIGAEVRNIEMNSNYTTIDVNNLPQGNYLMVITAGTTHITKKIVVQ